MSELEDLDRATNAFLREATIDDPARPPTYEVLFLILDAFGHDPIGYDAAVAESELRSSIQAKLSALRKSAARVTEILRKLLVPQPTYCVASYWDARARRRHAVGRRRTEPGNLANSLRSAYTFFVLTHRGEEKQKLATAVQFIARTRTVIRLAYVNSADDDLPESMFRLSQEECDDILATSGIEELAASVLPDFDLPTMGLRVESQMRNDQRLFEKEERPVVAYLEQFRGLDFSRHRALLNRLGEYLRGRVGLRTQEMQDADMMFILATSILYNRNVCPAKYLYPVLVPLGTDFSILTVGTDEPLSEVAQVVVHRFAQSLFQGLLAVDREHVHAVQKLKSLVERAAAQVHHNIRDPLGRTSTCIQELSDILQASPPSDRIARARALANQADEHLSFASLQVDVFAAAVDVIGKYDRTFVGKGRPALAQDRATDLGALVRTVVRLVSPDTDTGASWDLGKVPHQFWVKGRKEWWSVVLQILLKNALEASSAFAGQANVRVALRKSSDGYGALEVANESTSMTQEELRMMQQVLQGGIEKMEPRYMGLTTAGDALVALGMKPENVEVKWEMDRNVVTIGVTGIRLPDSE